MVRVGTVVAEVGDKMEAETVGEEDGRVGTVDAERGKRGRVEMEGTAVPSEPRKDLLAQAPSGPSGIRRGEFVASGPYGFRNVYEGRFGGRGRGGGILPGVVRGGGFNRGNRGRGAGVTWISSGLGTLVPKPG